MRYYDEMKYEQISEILGTSVGALKASYHLAVKKLKKINRRRLNHPASLQSKWVKNKLK